MTTQNIKSIFLFFLILIIGQSCKLNSSEKEDLNAVAYKKKEPEKLSLYEIETQNGLLIDSVEKRILKQIKQKDFINLYKEADTSLTKIIDLADIKAYFKMIDNFYGQLEKLKMYGTNATASSKVLDYIANYSTGDSLELHFKLRFYNHDAKLCYITMNRFEKDAIPENVLNIFKPKIETIFKKEYQKVYTNCSEKFKANISLEKISNLLDRHLKNKDNSYELLNCKPLIFGKGEIGFLAETQIKLKNEETKKIKIAFFLENKNDFKIADIQFSK